MEEYLSLFDYLGRAAGSDLGKQVAAYAKSKKVKPTTRFVETAKYKGRILMYPKPLLEDFFKTKEAISI